MHSTKYAVVYRTECVRGGSQTVRDVTFKVWANSGLEAMKAVRHERGVLKDEIKAIYAMKDGERVRIL